MKKIASLFARNYDTDRLVRDEVVPGSEWVLAGEGVPTEKIDGTCCLVRDGRLYRRYDCKRGKTPPPNWEPAQEPDPVTGHHPGWIPVGDGPEDRWHREAWKDARTVPDVGLRDEADLDGSRGVPDGTYELVGPKIQGNPYRLPSHRLRRHGDVELVDTPREPTFANLRDFLSVAVRIEGIVWHHPDGRLVKLKRRDFGLLWPTPEAKGAR